MELQTCDCLLMVLMRLRLSLQVRDVVDRFGVSLSTTSEFFQKWIDVHELCILLHWLTQESLWTNMHQFFKDQYSTTRCTIDSWGNFNGAILCIYSKKELKHTRMMKTKRCKAFPWHHHFPLVTPTQSKWSHSVGHVSLSHASSPFPFVCSNIPAI